MLLRGLQEEVKCCCLSLHSSTVSTKVKSNVNQLKGMRVCLHQENTPKMHKKIGK